MHLFSLKVFSQTGLENHQLGSICIHMGNPLCYMSMTAPLFCVNFAFKEPGRGDQY